MKIKKLILSVVTLSVFLISCSKEEINGVNIQPKESTEQLIPQSTTELSTESTQNARTSTETNSKAYIFVEPKSKLSMIVNHLKTVPHSVFNPPTNTPFYGFFTGSPIKPTNFSDLRNYVDMPHWYDGRLPAVIQSNITQTATNVYNFGAVKISGPLVNNQFVWITVLIPVNATPNPNWRQSRMASAHSNAVYRTPFNTNSTLSSYVLNYTGTRIPAGQYRVYSTYSGTESRPKVVGEFYLKGSNTLP
jgi:hypothetical protein